MQHALDGEFMGVPQEVSIEALGDNNTPALKVFFKVTERMRGVNWEPFVDGPVINKTWFLTPTAIKSGKYAGKSLIEVAGIQLQELFGYVGGLDESSIKSCLVGQKVKLTCRVNKTAKGEFTDIQYINKPYETKQRASKKAISAADLASLSSQFKGEGAKPALATADIWSNVPASDGHA